MLKKYMKKILKNDHLNKNKCYFVFLEVVGNKKKV